MENLKNKKGDRFFLALEREYRDKLAILLGVEYQRQKIKITKKLLVQALIDRALATAVSEGYHSEDK